MSSLEKSINSFDQAYKESGMRSQRSYPNEQLIAFIAQNYFHISLNQRKNIRVLEVGCGSGANLWMLAKEGFSTYGIDSSLTALDIAKTHLAHKWGVEAILRCGSITALPYEDEFFDVVVDIVTLQHLNLIDSKAALSEIRRVLRAGGKAFSFRLSDKSIMFMNSGADFIDAATVSNIENRQLPLSNTGPISFWSASLAREMYISAGLHIESIDSYSRTYNNGSYHVDYLGITATPTAS